MARTYGTGGPKAAAGTTGAGVSEREDLANFISMITRDETPFMSSIGKTKANAILHEWQTDELTIPGSNSVGEGVGYNDVAQVQANGPYRTRLGNYSQINSKTVTVSGTKRAVDQAGVADEYAYQLKKRGTELRRDVEWDLVHSNNSSTMGGTVSSAPSTYPAQFSQSPSRKFGGYQAFINFASNNAGVNNGGSLFNDGPSLVVGPSGNAGQVYTGSGVTVNGIAVPQNSIIFTSDNAAVPTTVNFQYLAPGKTDSTGTTFAGIGQAGFLGAGTTTAEQPLQLTAVDNLMQAIYQNGGKASKVMLSPSNRKAFSARAQGAGSNVRRNIDESGSLRQSVEMYMSDFGDIMVVPNYIMGLSNTAANQAGSAAVNTQDYFGIVYDPMWFNMASLRPLQEVDLGQLGDSIIGQIVEESSFEVRNPKGSGLIVGLNGQ